MGSGPAPRGALAACAAALLAAAVTGCSLPAPDPIADSAAGAAAGTPPPASGAAAPAPHPTSPEDLCAALVTHWAETALDGDGGTPGAGTGGLDYQSMGLSGDQYEILRAVLADARAERAARAPDGPAAGTAARRIAARGARERCAERHRTAVATGGPWG
ncbi:hypothetical protein ABZY31_22680 [Streptomyces sp. NPDC006529]|uniref:hypothetical protein n=1 Tax=Streptomyces sp. NPDC006529 TaxID=3157177 RepID=UPI0033A7E4BD